MITRNLEKEAARLAILDTFAYIEELRRVDATHLTDIAIAIVDREGLLAEGTTGSAKKHEADMLARMKAEISRRTGMSLSLVLRDRHDLFLPEELKLVMVGEPASRKNSKLHEGGVNYLGKGFGAAGSRSGRDCVFASNSALAYERRLAFLSQQQAA